MVATVLIALLLDGATSQVVCFVSDHSHYPYLSLAAIEPPKIKPHKLKHTRRIIIIHSQEQYYRVPEGIVMKLLLPVPKVSAAMQNSTPLRDCLKNANEFALDTSVEEQWYR
jgi:hypothetical protein